MLAKRIDSVACSQQTMPCSELYAALFAVNAETVGQVKLRVVRYSSNVDLLAQTVSFQVLLKTCQLRNRERTFQRIITARVEKHDDGRSALEELGKRQRPTVLIFKNSFFD